MSDDEWGKGVFREMREAGCTREEMLALSRKGEGCIDPAKLARAERLIDEVLAEPSAQRRSGDPA